MKTKRIGYRGKAFIFVIVAIALCLTLSVGAVLFGVRPSSDGGIAHAETAAPFRAYVSLETELDPDYTLYKGVTTVEGLKKNLTVTGVTADGRYTLTPDEYVIKRGDTTLAATDRIVAADSTDTSVTLQIESGSAVQTIVLGVAETAPAAVSALAVTVSAPISDDYTPSTVHKALTVKDGDTVLRSDLYTAAFSVGGSATDTLSAGQYVQITITTFDGKTATVSANVTAAALIGVDLRVAGDVTLDGLYYKRGGRDVFVRGSTNKEVFDNNLVITALYANSRKVVTPTYNTYDQMNGAEDRSYSLSVNDQSVIGSDEARRAVGITLSRNNGTEYSASLDIYFVEVAITEIRVNKDAFVSVMNSSDKYATRNSYTALQLADFMSGTTPAIEFVRNNGTTTTTVPTGATAMFVGNLAPTAQNIIDYNNAANKDDFTYSRDVSVQFTAANGNVVTSAPITISDIKYAEPSGMSNAISGTIATQTMHHEFDYSGLTVTVFYNSDRATVDFNLSDFVVKDNPELTKQFLSLSLYNSTASDAAAVTGDLASIITKETKQVSVQFTYGTNRTRVKWGLLGVDLDVVKDPVPAPELDTSTIVYTTDCYKDFADIAQLNYGAANFGHNNTMAVSLYSDAKLDTPVESEYAEYADGRINFYSGGTYYVKVALTGYTDEYTLTTSSSNIAISPNGDYAVYTIVVTKGMLGIGVDGVEDEIRYGDYDSDITNGLNAKIGVNGLIGGRSYKLIASGSAGEDELAVPYKLVFMPADKDTYNPDNYDYDTYTMPKTLDAGKYHVYAITGETKAYLASKSGVGRYAEIEILQKELEFADIANQTYTRGKDFKVSDFITSTGNFAYTDTADTVLSVTYDATAAVNSENPPVTYEDAEQTKPLFTHQGKYNVKLEIIDNSAETGNPAVNYKLKDTQDRDVVFTVEKRTFEFTATATGWTYGMESPNPNPSYTNGTPFYPIVQDVEYYDAASWNAETGKPETGKSAIDLSAHPFKDWKVGTYFAVYTTDYDPDTTYSDEIKYEDYDLPTAQAQFLVTAAKIDKITITDNGWNISKESAGRIGQYGNTIQATLNNYSAQNTAPSGDKIVTVTVTGNRLDPDKTSPIDATYLTGAFGYDTGKLSLTQAGEYTVTIKLNPNYTWKNDQDQNDKADIVYYGKIYKSYLTQLKVSDTVEYNGEKQTASVTVCNNGSAPSWLTDALESTPVLSIKSVVGTTLAAKGVTVPAADIDGDNGTFKVTEAGDYTVTVELKDKYNYEFNDGDTSTAAARVADRTLAYRVDQAAFKAIWDKTETDAGFVGTGTTYPVYDYDESRDTQSIPVGTPNVTYAADNEKLSVKTVQVYTDEDCTIPVTGNKVVSSGTYYIRVTEISGDAMLNYYLPTETDELGFIKIKFEIKSTALVIPTLIADKEGVSGTAVEVTFSGDDFGFSNYIKDFAEYVSGDIKRVVIKVDGIVTETMRDVKLDTDKSVIAYNVTVAPAANYSWDTENYTVPEGNAQYAFPFTFKITRLKVDLTWTKDGVSGGFVYGDGVAHTPAVSFDNNNDGAAAALALTYRHKGGTDAITDMSDAGVYTATVSLTGDKAGNYTLDGIADTDTTREFTVKKKVLGTPATSAATLTYNGAVQTVAYGWTDYAAKATGEVAGTNDNEGVADAYKTLGSCSFDSDKGELSFLHAGKYTVTFTLTETARKNYCWTNGGAEKFDTGVEITTTDELTVNRKKLLAPVLGSERAIAMQTEAVAPTAIVKDNVVTIDGVIYNIIATYGTYNNGYTGDGDSYSFSTARHTAYFIRIKLSADNPTLVPSGATFSPYDYVWEKRTDDTFGLAFVPDDRYGEPFYDENGVSICLCYVLTSKLVGAKFEFVYGNGAYTFGDNGYKENADEMLTLGSTFTLSNDTVSGKDGYFYVIDDKENKIFAYTEDTQFPNTLSDIKSDNYVLNITFLKDGVAVPESNIVNGLPWQQGDYTARIDVTFDNKEDGTESDLNPFHGVVPFKVNKLLAEVEWSKTDSAVYNGEGQTRAASVVNLPKKTAYATIDAPELVISKVTNVAWSGDSPAAQTVTIEEVKDANFTLDGVTNLSASFTITPKPIAVTGTDVAEHVYGDTIKDSEKAYTVNSGYAFEDGGSYITVDILDAAGKAVTATSNVGTYRVVPRLTYAHGNYVLADSKGVSLVKEGSFTVVARSLTVKFGSVSSVYGQSLVDLYAAANVTSSNGKDDFGIVSGQSLSSVLTLRAVDGSDNAINSYSHITDAKHAYKISCALAVGVSNYALDTFGEFAYEIKPAKITITSVKGYTGIYDAAEHNIFDIAATAVNDSDSEQKNELHYYYATSISASAEEWKEYTIDEHGVANKRVRNVNDALNGTYYIRITAENHETITVGDEVKVEVKKATLTVSVNLGIYYGENSPLNYDGKNNVFKATVADLRTNGGIYTIAAADFKSAADRALFYGTDAFYGLAANAASTMTYVYSSAAYSKGSAAGEYKLMFVVGNLACENYEFAAAEGKLTVSKLPVSIVVNGGNDLTATYNQENPTAPEITSITTAATSVYDGNTVVIYGKDDFANIATVVNPALDIRADGISTNNAGTYDVTVTLKPNYAMAEGGYAPVKYTITRADNKITTADYSLFVNAVSQKASAPATAAWAYGDYDSVHTTGYDPDGNQALKPVALLSRDADLTVKLTRMNDHTWDERVIIAPDGDIDAALKALFAQVHAASGFDSFYAGAFSVEFNMPQTTNYNLFTERWIFTVGKQELEITPASSKVVYGEGISTRELVAGVTPVDATADYPYGVSGLVKNNGALDALDDVVTFVVSSDYEAGYENGSVGTYNIRVAQVTGVSGAIIYDGDTYTYDGHNNYTVKFRTGTLTVTARPLSIEITDRTNYYNFIHYVTAADGSNGHYDVNEKFVGYTFTVTDGSFADGDGDVNDNSVFTLDSVAITGSNTTAAVGDYPIYLSPKTGGHYYSAKNGSAPNYAITVKDGYSGSVSIPDAAISQNAGTHSIIKAVINVTINDTPFTDKECNTPFGTTPLTYDGTAKYFKAEYSLPSNMAQTAPGMLLYYTGTRNDHTVIGDGSSDYAPKNAGQYYVEYKLTDDGNFSAPAAYKEYSIAKKTIAVAPRSVTNDAGAFVSIGGVYYFNGDYFTYGIDFTGLIAGENSYLTHTIEKTLYAGSKVAAGDKDAFMTFAPTVENSGFSFRVRNSGTYAVSITLADRGDFLAANYTFANGTDTYDITPFVIAHDTLYVDTKATSVEYGYALGSVADSKLGVDYKSMNYDARTAALIEAEQGMSVNGKSFLVLPATFNAAMFDSSDYSPMTSVWGGKYDLTLKASEITAYNFNIVPRGTDVLSIDAHKLTVEVKGYNDNVDIASCVYAGQGTIDNQNNGHNPHVADVFGSNRNTFLEITSDNGGFTAPNDYKDPFGSVTLRIPNGARDVKRNASGNIVGYPLAPSQDKTAFPMYDITFVNTNGDTIVSDLEDIDNAAKLPTWAILPATLHIAVGQNAANVSYANLVKSFTVPYGTDIKYVRNAATSTFAVRYSGWVNTDEGNDMGADSAVHTNHDIDKCTVLKGATPYERWTSIAGDEFIVTPVIGELTYTNYTIVPETATVRIAPLTVSATAAAVEYREAKNADGSKNYNGGKSGDMHDVSLTFASATEGITLPASGFAEFAYNVAYRTKAGVATSAGVNANSQYGAPIVVGEYRAAVTFKPNANGAYNYVFANGEDAGKTLQTFDHEVYKQTIVLSWAEENLSRDATSPQENTVRNYVYDIMRSVSLTCNDMQVASSEYTENADGFKVTVPADRIGTYRLLIRFNADAAKNYRWEGEDVADKVITFSVVVTGNLLTIVDLSIDDWIYGNAQSIPTANVSPSVSDGEFIYTYAIASGLDIDAILGSDNNRVVSGTLGGTLVYNATPRDAGWYVVRASYSHNEYRANSAYYLFKIDRAAVGAPVLGIITEGEGKNDMYNGNRLNADVMHSAQAYVTAFAGDRSVIAGGTRLTAVNANESGYVVRFELVDHANYVWNESALIAADGITLVRDPNSNEIIAVELKWVVKKADKHDIIWNDSAIWNGKSSRYELTFGDSYSVTARSTYSSSVRYSYAIDTGAGYEGISDWSNVLPTSAGKFFVKAECDGNNNYVSALAYRSIFIDRATLTATPSGSIVYGDAFADGAFDFRLSGYRTSERPEIVRGSNIEYMLADGSLDPANLDADDYVLLMRVDDDGHVLGVTLDNYYVVLAENGGVFTVERKRVAVKVGNASGVYLENIDLDGVALEVTSGLSAELTTAQIKQMLGVALSTTADSTSIVGRYAITATAGNGNYAVEFTDGEYTVTELRVRVEISAGGGEYDGEITDAVVTHIYTVNAGEEKDLIGDNILQFSYRYSGRSYSGVSVNGTTRPTLAGMYIATVTGIVNNANYILDLSAGDVSVPFVITRKVINANRLTIESKPYTGSAVEPTIGDEFYNIDGDVIYTVVPHEDFVNGGNYTFTLRLADAHNYRWMSVEDGVADRTVGFTITKAQNALSSDTVGQEPTIEIAGWTYGRFDESKNMPHASVKFGNELIVYTYASHRDGPYTTAIPSDGKAGEYWVRVSVRETDNYEEFVSEPVMFVIDKLRLTAPTLQILTEGEGKNDTYTGGELSSLVLGFDSVLMGVYYDGSVNINGSRVTVFAVNAGDYEVKISLKDPVSYTWADGTHIDDDGNAILDWEVKRKRLAKPTDSDKTLIVNGKILEYLPDGFDANTMRITGNMSGYGGTFTATVELVDTDNYVWEDGTFAPVEYEWQVVGAHTVFIAVIASLGGVAGALAIVAGVQFVFIRKKKRATRDEEVAE